MPADGICVDICPRDAIEIVDEKAQTVQSRTKLCIRCGQYVAVCPNEALELDALLDKILEACCRGAAGLAAAPDRGAGYRQALRPRRVGNGLGWSDIGTWDVFLASKIIILTGNESMITIGKREEGKHGERANFP